MGRLPPPLGDDPLADHAAWDRWMAGEPEEFDEPEADDEADADDDETRGA